MAFTSHGERKSMIKYSRMTTRHDIGDARLQKSTRGVPTMLPHLLANKTVIYF